MILDNLCASDCALMFAIMKYEPTSHDTMKYLQLYNEIPECKAWVTGMIEDLYDVLVIGCDVDCLIDRIRNPLVFWETSTGPILYNVFIIAVKIVEDPDDCNMLIEICSPTGTIIKEPHNWKRIVFHNNSRVGLLCVYHNDYGFGNVSFHIGGMFSFNTKAENKYDFIYDDVSLSLVSQMHNGKFYTKYINLSEKDAVVKEVSGNPVDYQMTAEYLCINITIHLEENSARRKSEVISFAIKK